MSTYVLVHGAWHAGDCYDDVAAILRAEGHQVHAPTLAGNRPGDDKMTGLDAAITSLVDYFAEHGLTDVILLGHSYGGMVITGAADRLPEGTVRRLVYWSAYVPNDGESLEDISPPGVREMHAALKEPDGSLVMRFPIWREALMNDADLATAERFYPRLNPHPHNTMQEKIRLRRNPHELPMSKSYLHCREDLCFPAGLGGWHPRFSERLGLFRFVSMPGGHEVCFTNPALLAAKIIEAGRD